MKMPEPTSTGAAGLVGWKLAGGAAGVAAGGAGLAALVVMCLTQPRSTAEWVCALVCTFVGSVCGGAWVLKHFEMDSWANDYIGLVAILGLVFACGLPAWALVRWMFNYIGTHRDDDIAEVLHDLKDIKDAVRGGDNEAIQ
jgi:hypothetical protein